MNKVKTIYKIDISSSAELGHTNCIDRNMVGVFNIDEPGSITILTDGVYEVRFDRLLTSNVLLSDDLMRQVCFV